MANASNRMNSINRKKALSAIQVPGERSGLKSDKQSKASPPGTPRNNGSIYQPGISSTGSMHNPELGGTFGVVINKDKEVEVRKGGKLFSISYKKDENFKSHHEIFEKLSLEFKEEIDKMKMAEEPNDPEEPKEYKKDGIYIGKDDKLVDIKKVYEFPEPPKPLTPKGYFSRKGLGLDGMTGTNLFGSHDDYKGGSYMGLDGKYSDIGNLKTSNTFLYHSMGQYEGMPPSNPNATIAKQPPDMDPEMLKLLRENQIKLGSSNLRDSEKEDPGIYTVPVFPNHPIHSEAEIQKKILENREEEEEKVCMDNIERIRDELDNPEQGIP